MSICGFNNLKNLPQIGVIGSSECSDEIKKVAFDVGYEIAKNGGVLVCGGLGGVMQAACAGAKKAEGITVAILPGSERGEANPYFDIAIVTGLSLSRNVIIVRSADVLISIAGGYGTLSEISFALALEKPVIGLQTWEIDAPIIRVATAQAAVEKAFSLISRFR